MQPQEFLKLIDGYDERQKNLESTAAYFTSWIINPHLKKPVSPLTIMEGLRPDEVKRIRAKQKKVDEEYLKRAFPDVFGKS